jgi:hypothetical protein
LGQSFEISIGPPKIEIHQGYDDHAAVNALCGIMAGIAVVYLIAYGLIPTYSPPSNDKDTKAVEQNKEQSGDRLRTITSLAYQLVADALLVAIMAVESALDNIEWLADDKMKQLFKVDNSVLELYKAPSIENPKGVTPGWWQNWGALCFGSLGVLAAVEAEILVPAVTDAG